MNALIAFFSTIASLATSLARTKELIDTANTRLEQSLGLTEPQTKMIDVSETGSGKRKKVAA